MQSMKLSSPSQVAIEADLDVQLKDLFAKIARGEATRADRQRYRELSMRRVRMMRPSAGRSFAALRLLD